MTSYWVYILASKPRGTLYLGVTNGIIRRVEEHRSGIGSAFTRKYKVYRLVWYQEFADIEEAIRYEKRLKHYVRSWKINLIERTNPYWIDLYSSLPGVMPATNMGVCGTMDPRAEPEDDSETQLRR